MGRFVARISVVRHREYYKMVLVRIVRFTWELILLEKCVFQNNAKFDKNSQYLADVKVVHLILKMTLMILRNANSKHVAGGKG